MTDKTETYYVWDEDFYREQGEQRIEAVSARAAAEKYVAEGDYEAEDSTLFISVYVATQPAKDEDEDDPNADDVVDDSVRYTITVDPRAPMCEDGSRDSHQWDDPHEIVGGIIENPGVWSHGGGVTIEKCCMICGARRMLDTWATNRATGEQGLDSFSYEAGYYTEALREYKLRAEGE